MKILKQIFILYFGILLLALTACTSSYASTQTSDNQTFFVTPNTGVDKTLNATTTPPTFFETPTRGSTLKSDDAYTLLKKMFQGSQSCQLPCWGGITPGISSSSEAKMVLQPLFDVYEGGPVLNYKNQQLRTTGGGRSFFIKNIEISFVFGWLSQQNETMIEMLQLKGFAFRDENNSKENIYGTEPYNLLFEEYNLHNILSTYGVPSKVLTFAYVYELGNDNPFPNPEVFQILLIYDEGIFVEYTMPLKRIGNGIGKVCPSEAFFNLWLVPRSTSEFYQEMWSSSTTGSSDFSYRLPIERSTQMTFDEFYQIFRQSNNPCIETPLDIWPEH